MANKMTKREKFERLLAMAQVKEDKISVEFIEHELELLAKKNSSDKKPTKVQEENKGIKDAILAGRSFRSIGEIEKHAAWFDAFRENYTFTEENTEDILKSEIGKTFVRVLRDAGVFKDSAEGREYFGRFIAYVNA